MSLQERELNLYDALLMEYACGALDEALSLLLATHLTLSPRARHHVSVYECMGGVLIEKGCTPVAMKKASLREVLEKLDCPDTKARCNPVTEVVKPPRDMPLPQPVCQALKAGDASVKWRWVYPGVSAISLPVCCEDRQMRLYRFKPGSRPPSHRHEGIELTVILEGAICDDSVTYSRGDLMIAQPHSTHSPRACPEQGCTCLVLSHGHKGVFGFIERFLGI